MYVVKKNEQKLEGDGLGEDPGPKQGPAGSSCSSSEGAQSTRHLLQGANHETELKALG